MNQNHGTPGLGAILLCLLLAAPCAHAERVKDLASVGGVRDNQLVGYGLVVGLDGSGDQTSQTPFTVQSLKNMLAQFGITVPPGVTIQLKNVAAVSIHAELSPFAAVDAAYPTELTRPCRSMPSCRRSRSPARRST